MLMRRYAHDRTDGVRPHLGKSPVGLLVFTRPRIAGTINAARADAIDSPAATTNAREYPALRAAVTDVPPWLAASAACARSVAMVASTARPREPPICREVLSTPEASPACAASCAPSWMRPASQADRHFLIGYRVLDRVPGPFGEILPSRRRG